MKFNSNFVTYYKQTLMVILWFYHKKIIFSMCRLSNCMPVCWEDSRGHKCIYEFYVSVMRLVSARKYCYVRDLTNLIWVSSCLNGCHWQFKSQSSICPAYDDDS